MSLYQNEFSKIEISLYHRDLQAVKMIRIQPRQTQKHRVSRMQRPQHPLEIRAIYEKAFVFSRYHDNEREFYIEREVQDWIRQNNDKEKN